MNLKPANFDPIARPYRWLEYLTLGPTLQRCRTHFLPRLQNQRRALVLGDGDGRFLAQLLITNQDLRADAVDTSAAMLHLLRKRCADVTSIRLRIHHHSALDHAPAASTDLVVTHFFLDCLTQSELDTLAHRMARHIQPNALWLVSDFRIPTGPLRLPARLFVRSLYLAFRILTGLRTDQLPDHIAALSDAGFTLTDRKIRLFGLLTSELWQLSAQQSSPTISAMSLPDANPAPDQQKHLPDPIPNPEPISPSLDEPDPGVFHHDPRPPQ